MNWMLLPYKRYAQFSGRSRRKEYWMWVLFYIVAVVLLSIADRALGLGGATESASDFGDGQMSASFNYHAGILVGIFGLISFIPALAVAVRRLHDTDKSGWWFLIVFIPLIGSIILLVFFCTAGTPGPNRFGADPKGGGDASTFS